MNDSLRTDNFGIVVGVDGSEGSARALRWAAAEAECLHLPLYVVHMWSWALTEIPLPHPVVEDGSRRAHELLDRATADLRSAHRHLEIEARVVNDLVVPGLVSLSGAAEMIVVGSHGGHGFAGMPIGSVAAAVATHSTCPAVVVRPQVSHGAFPVVIGVDGSGGNQAAVGFAFQEASARGLQLRALLFWHAGSHEQPTEAGAESKLTEALAPWQDKHPEVDVIQHVSLQAARPGLIAVSREASLLVVGSRGYGALRSRLLGSVSSALIQHADCPVAVVRSEQIRPGMK